MHKIGSSTQPARTGGDVLLLLLAGGDKSTQQKDIAKAIELARHFQE
jgi:putative component of toxin-antitoxin plasmid stabilization module